MFRKFSLCVLLGLLLVSAVSAGANVAVMLGLAALTALGVYLPLAGAGR